MVKKFGRVIMVIGVINVLLCEFSISLFGGVFPGTTWQTKTPLEVGLDTTKLNEFVTYVGGHGCIVRNGYMVYTWGDQTTRYEVGGASTPWYTHFLLKKVAEGILSLNDKVDVYEPRLDTINASLEYKDKNILWRHFPNQISCYGVQENPGTAFDYNDFQMALFFDTLFLKVYGKTWSTIDAEVLHPQLTDIIQCQDNPTFMAFGTSDRQGRLAISVRDFARFGLLYLNKGNWNGTQLIPANLAQMAVRTPLPLSIPRTTGIAAEMISDQRSIGSTTIPDNQTDHDGSYSFGWWINGIKRDGTRKYPDAPIDLYGAYGKSAYKLVVIPSLDMVVSLAGSTPTTDSSWNTAFKILTEAVIRCPQEGQIIVDPAQPQWLKYKGGSSFFMCGPGDPEDFLYRGTRNPDGTRTGDQMDLINKMKGTGANCIYMESIRSHGGDGDATQNPFLNYSDPNSGINFNILNQWEMWFTEMEKNGINIFFIFYDDDCTVFGTKEGPDTITSAEKRYIDTIVDCFQHHKNLIWCIAEEFEEAITLNRAKEIAAEIRAKDEYQHVIAVHQKDGLSFYFPDDPNIDQFAIQYNVGTASELHSGIVTAWNNANGRYNLNMAECAGQKDASRTTIRQMNWATAMGGAYCMVFGMDIKNTPLEQLQDCGRLRYFFESTNFSVMSPHDELKFAGTEYVLALPGNSYIAYASALSGNMGIKDMASGIYNLRWYDCVTGSTVTQTNVDVSAGNQSWAKPSGIGNEVALYIVRIGDGTMNNPPTVTLTGIPTTGTAPLGVTFSWVEGDVDGTIVSRKLEFGDGIIDNAPVQNVQHTYNSVGTYIAKITVTDDKGATGTSEVTIKVTTPSGSSFKVAICQQPESVATTVSQKVSDMNWALTNMADIAVANGANMIIFSETAFCSYDCASRPTLAENVPSSDPNESPVYYQMSQYAKNNHVWIYYGSYVKSSDPNKPYNSGIMIKPDGTLGFIYNKHYVSSSEKGCGTYGGSPYIFDIGHPLGKIGCLICKDFHAGGSNDIKGLSFDYMIGIAGDPNGRTGNNYDSWMSTIITTSPQKKNGGVWVNYATGGGSFFMDKNGNMLENVSGGGNAIVYHEYNLGNVKPVANSQNVTVFKDTSKNIVLTYSDPDGPGPYTFNIIQNPSHGTLSGSGANRTYTPASGYTGPDSFQFTVSDGIDVSDPATVNITVELASLDITDIWTASGKTYVTTIAHTGVQYYIDRTYTIATIPVAYDGLTLIKTANDDKKNITNPFLTFKVNQSVSVYVGYDTRITTKPTWLSEFTNTGDEVIDNAGIRFVLYKKNYSAGTVSLGGNEGISDSNMYIVLVKVSTSDDITPPAAPRGLTASAGDGQVTLNWTASSEPDLAKYNIYRSTTAGDTGVTPIANVAKPGTSYVDTGLTNGITYYYTVTAVDTSNNESNKSIEVSATPFLELIISNLWVASGKAYKVVDNLSVGSVEYIDRSYTFTSVPSSVLKQKYIKTANDDKTSTGTNFLTFDVNQPVKVYVAHDDRYATKPSWLGSFVDTGDDLIAGGGTFSLYVREYPAGTVSLGGNKTGTVNYSMYSVVIVPLSAGGYGGDSSVILSMTEKQVFKGDKDGDGVPDVWEKILGINPDNIDSDGDGIPDENEILSDGITVWDKTRFAIAPDLKEVKIYPNPVDFTKGEVVKFINLTNGATVTLYTISGEKINTIDSTLGIALWDGKNNSGENVARGLYIYLIKDTAGNKKVGKIGVIK
jgi:predicted amidohydrolase